jgi:hypothetical protein
MLRCTGACLDLAHSQRLDWCWLRWLRVIYRNYVSMRHYHKCNACGVKSGMLHAHAQLNHINPYKPFTNLLLVFLVF